MEINLQEKILPHFHEALYDRSFYHLNYGGRRGGKSRYIAQKIVYRCLTEKNHRVSIIRNTGSSHVNSTFAEMKEVLRQFNLMSIVNITINPLKIMFPQVDSEITFYGCDDTEKLKGMISTMIWFEEVTEIDEDDFNTVMAGFSPSDETLYKQVLLSFNPVNESHWVKRRFFEKNPDSDRTFILHSSYKNNPYLPKETVQYLENLKLLDKFKYEVHTLGMWGRLQVGGEYYKNFDQGVHLVESYYDKSKPLHISFDFNILPGMSIVIAQLVGKDIHFIDSMQTTEPLNTIYGICQAFVNKYGEHKAGVYIYGDPSGKKQNYAIVENNFTLIGQYLADFQPKMRVLKHSPGLYIRQQWFAMVLGEQESFKIRIDHNCKYLIDDYMFVKEDEQGGKDKRRTTNRNTGQRYEQYGHHADAADYLLLQLKGREWKKFTKSGGLIQKLFVPKRNDRRFRY